MLAAARAGRLAAGRVSKLGVSKAAYGMLAVMEECRALLAQLEGSFQAMQDELLACLSPEDRVELHRLLALIAAPAPA